MTGSHESTAEHRARDRQTPSEERDTVLPSEAPAWKREEPLETWPDSEPPEPETLRPPAGEVPEELPPDSDDMRDTIPSPAPPPGAPQP
ncbi:MAG: hypothetical protein R3B13_33910 [Polyangiaceae bacterium]